MKMYFCCEIKLLLVVLLCSMVITVYPKNTLHRSPDAIGFPEVEENINLKNKEDRRPVYSPMLCPENELFYPGDQKDDWICDCMPAHIYQPKTDKCWPAYRQGPCEEGQYLILPQNSVLPVCVKNPCVTDSYVLWEGNCTKIGLTAPCERYHPAAAVGVNSTTLTVSCVLLNFEIRIGVVSVSTNSSPGSKKYVRTFIGKA